MENKNCTPRLNNCVYCILRVQNFVPSEELCGILLRISDKVVWRRLGLAGHCFRHKEPLAGELVLWKLSHGRRGRGRPYTTFDDTPKRDLAASNKSELESCMVNQDDWRARLGRDRYDNDDVFLKEHPIKNIQHLPKNQTFLKNSTFQLQIYLIKS